jgi:hypothetical protein
MKRPASLLAATLITIPLAVSAAPASATETTAKALMTRLVVKAESGSGYERSYFKHWVDANGDCQHTRTEVLVAESTVKPTYSSSRHCTVVKGRWYSTYDGKTWTNPSDVDIDHVVALKEAWDSGAKSWSAANRTRFANDLGYSGALIAVTDNVNSSKSDSDPAQWLPPRLGARCTYAIRWAKTKYRWRLSINSAERSALASILSGNCGTRTVTLPARAI